MREELPVEAPPEGRIAFLRTPVGFLAVSIILLLAAYSALVIAWQWQKPTRKLMRGGAQVRLSMQGNAASVSFPPREIHQSELLLLKELPDLRMLEFRGSRISDDELIRALDRAPQITIVRLQETVCSPELVAALMERSRLRRLIFDRCSIEDVDHFADLASRQRREEISLTAVPMTLTQYEKLAPQPGVKLDIPAADLMRAGPSLRVEWLDPLRVRFKLFLQAT